MKFKVGDRVKVIKNVDDSVYDTHIGKIANVVDIDEKYSRPYQLDLPDCIERISWWYEEELQKVPRGRPRKKDSEYVSIDPNTGLPIAKKYVQQNAKKLDISGKDVKRGRPRKKVMMGNHEEWAEKKVGRPMKKEEPQIKYIFVHRWLSENGSEGFYSREELGDWIEKHADELNGGLLYEIKRELKIKTTYRLEERDE